MQTDFCLPRNVIEFIFKEVEVVAAGLEEDSSAARSDVVYVKWRRPSPGFVRLNCDGASEGNPGAATIGGVFRDDEGRWLLGYSSSIGVCLAMVAEFMALRCGLEIAWERGWRAVEVSVHSKVVEAVNAIGDGGWLVSDILHDILDMLRRDWEVRIEHCYLEGNKVADALANRGLGDKQGVVILAAVAPEMTDLVWADLMGASSAHLVPA